MTTKYCSQCGTLLEDGDLFCPECGATIVDTDGGNVNLEEQSSFERLEEETKASAERDPDEPQDEKPRPAAPPHRSPPRMAPKPAHEPASTGDRDGAAREVHCEPAIRGGSNWLIWSASWAIAWAIGSVLASIIFIARLGGSIILLSAVSSMDMAVLVYMLIFLFAGLIAGLLAAFSLHFANGRLQTRTWPAALISGGVWLVVIALLGTVSVNKLGVSPSGKSVHYEQLHHFYFLFASAPVALILALISGSVIKLVGTPPPHRALKLAGMWLATALLSSALIVILVVASLGNFEVAHITG